jgi:flagellar export protein FliJ
MKSRETLIRLKRFHVDEKRRQVMQIETMIADLERMAAELEREIESEERKAGISDPAHYAYPTYAKATRSRRDKLVDSAKDLTDKLEEAKLELQDAFDELKKIEILEDREKASERAEIAAREQAEMDRIGARMRMHSRG